jgi:nicotinamide-nucleotide amidase
VPVEIISVGSEYILQRYQNSSVATIAGRLLETGVEVDYVSSVVGQEGQLEEVLRQAIGRSNLIFVVGGVSSGDYDVTKKLLTRVLKKRLVLNYRILDSIKEQYKNQGEDMPRNAEKRALVPTDAEILTKELGTVPGFLFMQDKANVVLLPGRAHELDVMLKQHILPRLESKTFRLGSFGALVLKTCGMATEDIKDALRTLERAYRHYKLDYVTDCEETSIIVSVRGDMQSFVDSKLDTLESQIRKRLGSHVYGTGAHTLEEVVGALLKEQNHTVALAESCTGGMIAAKLTNVPGSSAYFERGVVSYSNEAKISLLDVSSSVIEKHGAVSAETAVAMAEGVRWIAQTTYGLSVTGIAGPDGGTKEKPVGLVYIALASEQGKTHWHRYKFEGDRWMIRTRAAQTALNLLRQHIGEPDNSCK